MRTISTHQKTSSAVPNNKALAQHRQKNNFRVRKHTKTTGQKTAAPSTVCLFPTAIDMTQKRPKPALSRLQLRQVLLRKRSAFVAAQLSVRPTLVMVYIRDLVASNVHREVVSHRGDCQEDEPLRPFEPA